MHTLNDKSVIGSRYRRLPGRTLAPGRAIAAARALKSSLWAVAGGKGAATRPNRCILAGVFGTLVLVLFFVGGAMYAGGGWCESHSLVQLVHLVLGSWGKAVRGRG